MADQIISQDGLPQATKPSCTILLVEDNEMNRDMLTRRLERRGYSVITAPDGRDGLEKAHSFAIDLILLDMNLPELDGWEVARRLKADETTNQIPIIALTAHALVEDRNRALEAGCDEYDTKPVELLRLLSKIQSFLPTPPGDSL
jgi:two-component system, cell cycle response regulator DivK